MTPDDFCTELRDSLTSFYEGVLRLTSPAQDHQTLIRHKALPPFLPHPVLGPILSCRPRSLGLRLLRCWPEPPAAAEQSAASKQGKGAKGSGKGG